MADMTTRDELEHLAERISQAGTIEIVDADLIDRNFSASERDMIASALRLASRQEASLEEMARLIEGPLLRRSFENRVEGYTLETSIEQASALLAEYSIKKREG